MRSLTNTSILSYAVVQFNKAKAIAFQMESDRLESISYYLKDKMTRRLQILQKSLAQKNAEFNLKLEEHFATVKQANGQPLNDKPNGQSTLNKWDRQNEALQSLKLSIEKTEKAISIEENKIYTVDYVKDQLPQAIADLIEKGVLNQWRRYPHIFFVAGVDKARIIWDAKKRIVAHKFANQITDQDQRSKFVKVYNSLSIILCSN
jgi:hypothetical protein